MSTWYLGETRYVYTVVTSSTSASFTITSAKCTIYKVSDESAVVDNADATINGAEVYYLFTPSEIGQFVVDFDYIIGSETFTSRQFIDVKETM